MYNFDKVIKLIVICFLLIQPISAFNQTQENSSQEANIKNKIDNLSILTLNQLVKNELKSSEIHNFLISLKMNDFLQLSLEQKSIDVIISLFSPSGKKLKEINRINFIESTEELIYIADSNGDYKLEIKPAEKDSKPGYYQIQINQLHIASEQDKQLFEADNLEIKATEVFRKGKYDEALTLTQQTLKLQEQALGKEHQTVAGSLLVLGQIYRNKADYDNAEIACKNSLEIYEKTLGKEHADTASVLDNLARIYQEKGEYDKAEPLYNKALQIREKTLGKEHFYVSNTLGNLAAIYKSKGEYDKAEPLYNRALQIREKSLGAEHAFTSTALNNLAEFYKIKGDYDKAEMLFKRALDIREKTFGNSHPNTALSLNNLAELYRTKKEYDKAEPLYNRALQIYEKSFDPFHPTIAVVLSNLAVLYNAMTEYDKSETVAKRALDIREKALGTDNLLICYALNSLAAAYQNKKEHDKAEVLFKKALDIREKYLGLAHPDTAFSLNQLANFFATKGELEKAIDYKIKADEVRERDLERNLSIGSEYDKLKYLNLTALEKDTSISLHLQSNNQQACKMALTAILRRKGRSLDAMANAISLLRSRASGESQLLIEQLSNLQTQLSNLVLKGANKDNLNTYKTKIKELEDKIEGLQSQISSKSVEFRTNISKISLDIVQKAIPPDSVLIEFSTYKPYDFKAKKYGEARYVVYLLSNQGDPLFAELGEAQRIDQVVKEFRQVLVKEPDKSLSNIQKELKPKARTIDQLVMQPIRKFLTNKKHLLIAPDGNLNLVPFDAFVDEKGNYLIESYEISYLTSGRDLIRLENKIPSQQPPTILANPDYGDGDGPTLAGEKYKHLNELPSTGEEAANIKTFFPNAKVYLGKESNKAVVKELDSPEMLHIATHGYFLTDSMAEKENNDIAQRSLYAEDKLTNISYQELKLLNPLLRSWLFFAGANDENREQDSVMTALESTSINLFGTKLVVLSACETGLGEVKNGEGVYGLRRALVLAGAETQLISLWTINDNTTRGLMNGYYKLLKAGETRSNALRKIQLVFLHSANQNTKNKKASSSSKLPNLSHPYYWAGFIQSGEWATLDGKR